MEVIILRTLVPLLIFKFPFVGGLISAGLDYFDLTLISTLQGNLENYQNIDKLLDFYYLSIEVFVASSWINTDIRKTAIILFLYRGLGIFLFELTGIRQLLFLFPNFFEFFFLLYLFYQGISGKNYLTTKKDKIFFYSSLFVLFGFKLYHEFSLHVLQREPWPGSNLLKFYISFLESKTYWGD